MIKILLEIMEPLQYYNKQVAHNNMTHNCISYGANQDDKIMAESDEVWEEAKKVNARLIGMENYLIEQLGD